MALAVDRHRWNHTAHIMWVTHNSNSNLKRSGLIKSPNYFNPYKDDERKTVASFYDFVELLPDPEVN